LIKKGLVLSKTAFILKSKATDFEFDKGIPTQCNICHYSEFMTSFGNCLKCDMNIDTFDDYELTSNQITNDVETLQHSILPTMSRIKSNRLEIATKLNSEAPVAPSATITSPDLPQVLSQGPSNLTSIQLTNDRESIQQSVLTSISALQPNHMDSEEPLLLFLVQL